MMAIICLYFSFYVTFRVISFRWNVLSIPLILCLHFVAQNITIGIDVFTWTHQYSVWLQIFWNSHDFPLFFGLLSTAVLLDDVGNEQSSTLTPKSHFFSLYRKQDSLCTSESSRDWSWLSNRVFQKPVNHQPTQIFTSGAPQISRYAVCWGQKYWLRFFRLLSGVALWSNRLLYTVDC